MLRPTEQNDGRAGEWRRGRTPALSTARTGTRLHAATPIAGAAPSGPRAISDASPGAYSHRMAAGQPATEYRPRDHLLWSLVATVILTTMMRGTQAFGITRMDLPLMLGTMLTPDRDRAKVAGFLAHLLNGWIFGAIYTAAFHSLGRSNARLGAAIGFVHGLFVLVSVLPLLPGIHPRMASDFTGPQPTTRLEPPGFLALNYGRSTPAVTLTAHVIYGAILGHFYDVRAKR